MPKPYVVEWTWQEHVEQWVDCVDTTALAPYASVRLVAIQEAAFARALVDPEYERAAAAALKLGGLLALLAFVGLGDP